MNADMHSEQHDEWIEVLPNVSQQASRPDHAATASTSFMDEDWGEVVDARPILPKAAFFMGDLRDGLPMVRLELNVNVLLAFSIVFHRSTSNPQNRQLNMQAAFLISARSFTEKQVGTLFFFFGMSQFLCMAPSGYFLDYSNNKINWVIWSGCATATLTVVTTLSATPFGENMGLMIILKILQGGITAIMPPGFNGITLGIVGASGFTHQVSRNRMMNHMGSALNVAIGSLTAYYLYPNIGNLFIVSPLAAIGMYYNLRRIKPTQVNKNAARGLIIVSPTMTEYEHMDDEKDAIWIASSSPTRYNPPETLANDDGNKEQTSTAESMVSNVQSSNSFSSFPLGWYNRGAVKPDEKSRRAQSPIGAILDPSLIVFSLVVFFFHLSNSSVLPLVMQTLSLQDPQAGILLSSLCILIAQAFMAFFAKICGDYSPVWGRKGLMLVGLFSLTIRCFLLTFLVSIHHEIEDEKSSYFLKALILSTQLLDSVGAGIVGTLHILVTSDISGGTGRFSLMMGITTAAMCLGGTVSGYIGQALAQDYGYPAAFSALGMMSLIPFFIYALFMPETLPDYARPKPKQRKKRLAALLRRLNAQRKDFTARITRRSFQPDKVPGAAQMELV